MILKGFSSDTIFKIREQLMNGKPSGKIKHLINRKINFENILSDVISFSNKAINK